MATPFSRTVRSLQTDNHYLSLAGLLTAILLALFWTYWFVTAQIVSYETSQDLYVTHQETVTRQFNPNSSSGANRVQTIIKRIIIAQFPLNTIKKIQPGQMAYIRLDNPIGQQIGPIPAVVLNTIHSTDPNTGSVLLRTEMNGQMPNPFETGGMGKVQVEIEHATPITLVLRASGLLTETPSVSASPQPRNLNF